MSVDKQATIVCQDSYIFYDPAEAMTTPNDSENLIKSKKTSASWFSKFFVFEDGVISLSLKVMTIVISLGVSATLLVMGYTACTDGTFTCTQNTFPAISDVIISKEMYNRIFLLLTTVMMFGVQ